MIKKHKWKLIVFATICLELFVLYLFVRSSSTYEGQAPNLSITQFTEGASVIENDDWVGAHITLKEVVHGLDRLTYRYIVKTDCPNWDFETRYVADEPLEWADEYASAETLIYDIQIRYNGTVYASGTYYTIPILGGISSESVSIEQWKENLMKQAYQAYISEAGRNAQVRIALVCVLIGLPVLVMVVHLVYGPKKEDNKEAT